MSRESGGRDEQTEARYDARGDRAAMGDRVCEAVCEQCAALRRGTRVIVGISGGQDSCALLHALASLQDDLKIRVAAAHVHHGMRGDAADADAAFVAQLCERLEVRLETHRVDVPEMAQRLHLSEEEAGRRARHDFFALLTHDDATAHIALGHTADDRAETVLLNILRGAGLDGLAAMPAVDGRIIRPLLALRRRETADYCERHGIAYRHDATNDSQHYRRNRLRASLIPLLEHDHNPRVRDALIRLAELAADDAATLDRLAGHLVDAAEQDAGAIVLRLTVLESVDRSIIRRAIREAIRRVKGDLVDVGARPVERLVSLIGARQQCGAGAWSHTLPSGSARLVLDGDALRVEPVVAPGEPVPISRELPVPGSVTVVEWEIRVVCELLPSLLDTAPGRSAPWVALNAASLRPPLVVRNRRRGDRVRAVGQPGTRKLQDILVDRKVPRAERDRVPIVADADGIVWVAGHALAERAAPATGHMIVAVRIEDF